METKTVEVAIAHPAEKIFGFETGSTVVDQVVVVAKEPVVANTYDEKDQEIDSQYDQVYNAAFEAFETQRMATEGMNPQFANRALEVASQFLNTALAAATAKSNLKQGKDKLNKVTSNNTVNNTNNIIMDRNEMLRMLMRQQEATIIDQDD